MQSIYHVQKQKNKKFSLAAPALEMSAFANILKRELDGNLHLSVCSGMLRLGILAIRHPNTKTTLY